ncbi:TetR/AcrR family transcriptional regulator [Lichenihabitans sp. PAMC28606]|uniref:TetR/AcrR family transcriptional regulator n=1 Tax=Lichenihabitans sp. PAMC28606 TaxID=2880932 RepID=UPI001D0A0BB0|nr:TetR/AcrR family transcriptional regulator [Lichenihabitans sp. PAMC28606]UDL93398.1 TetR/AcrR family transcriptional regulator [Lichenihabitans sp. PAMC28606]
MNQPVQTRSIETLRKILEAAEAVIGRSGAQRLTMDAVAAEAGISKGGVLHHFRTKEGLIAALVRARLERYVAEYKEEEAAAGPGEAAYVVAMIRHMKRMYSDDDGFPRSLLVAATDHPAALEEFRAVLRQKLDERRDGQIPEIGVAMLFATLGLLLTKTLGFVELSLDELHSICKSFERLASSPSTMAAPTETVD